MQGGNFCSWHTPVTWRNSTGAGGTQTAMFNADTLAYQAQWHTSWISDYHPIAFGPLSTESHCRACTLLAFSYVLCSHENLEDERQQGSPYGMHYVCLVTVCPESNTPHKLNHNLKGQTVPAKSAGACMDLACRWYINFPEKSRPWSASFSLPPHPHNKSVPVQYPAESSLYKCHFMEKCHLLKTAFHLPKEGWLPGVPREVTKSVSWRHLQCLCIVCPSWGTALSWTLLPDGTQVKRSCFLTFRWHTDPVNPVRLCCLVQWVNSESVHTEPALIDEYVTIMIGHLKNRCKILNQKTGAKVL